MALGSLYPAEIIDANGNVTEGNQIQFTSSADQPLPQTNPITAGTLPNLGAWVSGTAKANPAGRQITVGVEVACDVTNNDATCAVAISPNGTDFTTLGTFVVEAAINTQGGVNFVTTVTLPSGWSIKLTLVHTTVAASFYY